MQGKAEDAGILSYVKDDNAAMYSAGHRTCSDICLVCYNFLNEVVIVGGIHSFGCGYKNRKTVGLLSESFLKLCEMISVGCGV